MCRTVLMIREPTVLNPQALRIQVGYARRASAQARDNLRGAKQRLARHELFLERSRASLIVRFDHAFGAPHDGGTGPAPRVPC